MAFEDLERLINEVPDFPKKGILFKDISPLLKHKFSETIDAMASLINWGETSYVAGIESRGFIFAAALAQKLGIGFIPIRKKGKLPPPIYSQSYELEYGQDQLEIATEHGSGKVVLIDDVIATGGTMRASISLAGKAGLEVAHCMALINLKFLNNLDQEVSIKSVFTY